MTMCRTFGHQQNEPIFMFNLFCEAVSWLLDVALQRLDGELDVLGLTGAHRDLLDRFLNRVIIDPG